MLLPIIGTQDNSEASQCKAAPERIRPGCPWLLVVHMSSIGLIRDQLLACVTIPEDSMSTLQAV